MAKWYCMHLTMKTAESSRLFYGDSSLKKQKIPKDLKKQAHMWDEYRLLEVFPKRTILKKWQLWQLFNSNIIAGNFIRKRVLSKVPSDVEFPEQWLQTMREIYRDYNIETNIRYLVEIGVMMANLLHIKKQILFVYSLNLPRISEKGKFKLSPLVDEVDLVPFIDMSKCQAMNKKCKVCCKPEH